MITLHTNFGDMTIELDFDKAPLSAANFQQYAEDGFYEGTIFHRIIDGFMIQGGGFTPDMEQKETREPIANEADNGLKNDCYTLAMARTMDPDSASSQFFINVKDNDFLNHSSKTTQGWGYCVFGKIVDGHDIVDTIKAVKTGSTGFHQDVPVDDVIIEKVTIQKTDTESTTAESADTES